MRLIIADDSEMMRGRIKDLVEQHSGVEIVGNAKNGVDALQLVNEHKPDLLILDFKMPGLNGLEVLKKIKQEGIQTKVCILTNYPYQQYKVKCFAEGADYFFNKTEEFKRVNEVVAEILNLTKKEYLK